MTDFQRLTVGQVYLSRQDTFPYQWRRALKRNVCARTPAHTHMHFKNISVFKSMSVDFIYMKLLYGLGSQFPTCSVFSLGIYLQKKKFNSQAALLSLMCVNFVSVVPCAA